MKIALITPSYAPDAGRCRLLVETAERCVRGNTTHYLIIDRQDLHLFHDLASPRTRILVSEELLPDWIARDPRSTSHWSSRHSPPITNWIVQQLLKLSVFDVIPEPVAVFCDSDVAFVRPFDPAARLHQNGRLHLMQLPAEGPDWDTWRRVAAQLLGLSAETVPPCNHVGNLIAWRRENVMAMRARIEHVQGRPWLQAVVQHPFFSEYMLYGIFVEQVRGLDRAGHVFSNAPLILPSWGWKLERDHDLRQFFQTLTPEMVGIMVHSRGGPPVARYRDQVLALVQASTTPKAGL